MELRKSFVFVLVFSALYIGKSKHLISSMSVVNSSSRPNQLKFQCAILHFFVLFFVFAALTVSVCNEQDNQVIKFLGFSHCI